MNYPMAFAPSFYIYMYGLKSRRRTFQAPQLPFTTFFMVRRK